MNFVVQNVVQNRGDRRKSLWLLRDSNTKPYAYEAFSPSLTRAFRCSVDAQSTVTSSNHQNNDCVSVVTVKMARYRLVTAPGSEK